jgi:transcriptional regulator with XRE-family HTH domain
MHIPLTSVLEAGIAIRTMRKRAGIRIDDFALIAGVSKQFMTDLENGKATVQMGMVLQMLHRLGVKVGFELPDTEAPVFQSEMNKAKLRLAARQSRLNSGSAQPQTSPTTSARALLPDGNGLAAQDSERASSPRVA